MPELRLSDLDNKNMCPACPFNIFSEEHEMTQNYGCLPDGHMVLEEYKANKGHWKCHSGMRKCAGLTEALKLTGIKRENNNLFANGDNGTLEKTCTMKSC